MVTFKRIIILGKPVRQDTPEQERMAINLEVEKCPKCQSVRTIYHFNWSGLTCPECKESNE